MKKQKLTAGLIALAAIIALSACPPETEFEEETWDETAKFTTYQSQDTRVIHTAWIVQNVDPRAATGYQTAEGLLWFDHIAQSRGLLLSEKDCSALANFAACSLSGLHFCFELITHENVFARYSETVEPLRRRGHKWLLNIAPDPIAVGMLYARGGEAVEALIEQLVQIHRDYPFDGIAYSDGFDTSDGTDMPLHEGGENILRFAHEINAVLFGPNYDKWSSEHEGISSRPRRRLIQELLEEGYSGAVPESFTYPEEHHAFPGLTIYREDVFDVSSDINYGGFRPNSRNPNFPRSKYSPFGIDLGENNVKARPIESGDGGGLLMRLEDHLYFNTGVIRYYHLTSRAYTLARHGEWYLGHWPFNHYWLDRHDLNYYRQWQSFIGQPLQLDRYLSIIGLFLYNTIVINTGDDYREYNFAQMFPDFGD